MASSYSTDLKLELMVTGENSGTWGDKTNTNLNLVQQAIAGYEAIDVASADVTLAMTNATLSNARNMVFSLTGTLAGTRVVNVPDGIEKTYIVADNTTRSGNTLTIKTVSGTGVTIPEGKTVLVYADGTNVNDVFFLANVVEDSSPQLGGDLDANGNNILIDNGNSINDENDLEQIKFSTTASAVNEFTVANAATGNNPTLSATGGDTNIGIDLTTKGTGFIKFNDAAYNPEATLTDAATITWDAQAAPVAKVTLTDNRTMGAPSNGAAGQFISLLVIQDAGGTNTLTWNAVYEFASDTAPTLTATGDLGDLFVFRYNGTKWLEVGRNLALTLS